MLRVGITGGIGSGKSTVARIFEHLGVPVYHADEETKKLYSENAALREKIIRAFGPETYEGNELNRSAMASLVFRHAEKLQELNSIVHPYVFANYEAWCEAHRSDPYTLKEAAILFESGSYRRLHLVIGVIADEALRISRVVSRDHVAEKAVRQRMENQLPQEELRKKCDYIIENDGTKSLTEQVVVLHKIFLLLSEQPLPKFRS
jgi:dephospho-CoA kinase